MLNPHYVTGFVDGEGSFSVTISPRKKLKTGWEIRPSFSVSQNKLSRGVLYNLKEFFKCGSVRPSTRDNTFKFEVRKLEDLHTKIIPHFKKFPMHTIKQKEFKIFSKIVKLMTEDKHLEKETLKMIVELLCKLNSTSKKVYSRKELQRLMNV